MTKSVDAVCKRTPNGTWGKRFLFNCNFVYLRSSASWYIASILLLLTSSNTRCFFFIRTGVSPKKSCLSNTGDCCSQHIIRYTYDKTLMRVCYWHVYLLYFYDIFGSFTENERHKTSPNVLDARDMFTRSYIKLLIGFIFISMAWHGSGCLHGWHIRRCTFCWRLVRLTSASSGCYIAHCNLHIGYYTKKCASHDNFISFSLWIDNFIFRTQHFLHERILYFSAVYAFFAKKQPYWAIGSRWYDPLPPNKI